MGENGYRNRLLEAGFPAVCGGNSRLLVRGAALRISRRRWRTSFSAGFTLLELVVTLIIVSVLAVAAIASLNTTEFDARGYFDQTQNVVRFAQKLAIARRGLIYVDFTGAFKICSTPVSPPACSCSTPLTPPTGAMKLLPSDVTLGASTTTFCFDASGRPLLTTLVPMAVANTVTVTSGGVRSFLVEAETGYVH